jgi:hypothetical protein
MRPSRSFKTLLATVLASAALPSACSSGSGGDLDGPLSSDSGTTDGAPRDAARDGATGDGGADVTIVCNPPPPETKDVTMKDEYCYGWNPPTDGGADAAVNADAGVSAATCSVNCTIACEGAFSSSIGGMVQCTRKSETEVTCTHNYLCGRAPEGFAPLPHAKSLGELFCVFAKLESAAVLAFDRMALELAAHEAPLALVRDAERAASDERRHTRMMTTLARRYGCEPDTQVDAPSHVRPLFEIALENAVEGCVRETFGAVLAMYQSANAPDPKVRCAIRAIAEDESAHAELSWRVARCIEARLTAEERLRIESARAEAFDELEREAELPLWRESGLPHPTAARALVRELRRAVA